MPIRPRFELVGPEAAYDLLIGSSGGQHLTKVAISVLGRAGQAGRESSSGHELFRLGADILLAAWEEDPLDGPLAGQLLTLIEAGLGPSNQVAGLAAALAAVRDNWTRPDDQKYFSHLLAKRETGRLQNFLEQKIAREPGNLYWIRQGLALALFEADLILAGGWLDKLTCPALAPVRARQSGHLAMFGRDFELARRCYEQAGAGLSLPGLGRDLAACLGQLGRPEEALQTGLTALSSRPWDVNLALSLYDGLSGGSEGRHGPVGRTAILLYTWNKAEELATTLASLEQSRLTEDTLICVLDNGSTDQTGAIIKSFADRFGSVTFKHVRLPINIGAPAARNWLLRLPEVAACSFQIFLDDDVILPQDWLERLFFARSRYPEAGVWGCRVLDAANPLTLQNVDLHLMPAATDQEVSPALSQARFALSDLHHQTLDLGQFNYIRPCASVTGCCHMFSQESVNRTGLFDLRFSPSQYDDLDHDLRLLLDDHIPVYQGFLAIKHLKRTGGRAWADQGQWSNSMGNMYKLQKKYGPEQVRTMLDKMSQTLRSDLETKLARINELTI